MRIRIIFVSLIFCLINLFYDFVIFNYAIVIICVTVVLKIWALHKFRLYNPKIPTI